MNDEKRKSTMTGPELDATHLKYEKSGDVYFYRPNDFKRADEPSMGMIVIH